MDYSLGSTSAWPSWVDTSYDQPVYDSTVTSDIATQGQAVTATPTNDSWGDWFKGLASSVVNYSLAKDAVQTKAAVQGQATTQPGLTYAQPAQTMGINANMLMLAGVAVAAVLLLKK